MKLESQFRLPAINGDRVTSKLVPTQAKCDSSGSPSRTRCSESFIDLMESVTGESRSVAALIKFASRVTGRDVPCRQQTQLNMSIARPTGKPWSARRPPLAVNKPRVQIRNRLPDVLTRQLWKNRRERQTGPSTRAYNLPVTEATGSSSSGESDDGEGEGDDQMQAVLSLSPTKRRLSHAFPSRNGSFAEAAPEDFAQVVEEAAVHHLPWNEDVLRVVFKKFSFGDDHEIHVEELFNVLEYLGARPDLDEIEDMISEYTRYSSMNWQEYLDFMRFYREKDIAQLRVQFGEADMDGNNSLDEKEVHHLLQTLGYSPTASVTAQAFRNVDSDGDGQLNFKEFESLREHLRKTRGFLSEEAAELNMIFMRVAGPEHEMNVDEIPRIKSYLGFNIPVEECTKIVVRIDRDRCGILTFDELLLLVRTMMDYEHNLMVRLVLDQMEPIQRAATRFKGKFTPRTTGHANSLDCASTASLGQYHNQAHRVGGPSLAIGELDEVLAKMGYFVTADIIEEILTTHLKSREKPDSLTVCEMEDFLRAYRLSEGFTKEETDDLMASFLREQATSVAGNDNSTLDVLELGRVLRWFGISKSLQQVKHLIDEVDFDANRQLEFREFTKLMRKFFQEEFRQRRLVFDRLKAAGRLPVERLAEAVEMITGHEPDPAAMMSGLVLARKRASVSKDSQCYISDGLTRSDFDLFFKRYREKLRETIRTNAGYLPSEVLRLRSLFNSYDPSGKGHLCTTALRKMIEECLPEATYSQRGKDEMNAMMRDLVHAADNDDNHKNQKLRREDSVGFLNSTTGGLPSRRPKARRCRTVQTVKVKRAVRGSDRQVGHLDFSRFLILMRRSFDQRDERDIVQEDEAMKDTGFTPDEVESFRQIFLNCVDHCGELDFAGAVGMFDKLTYIDEEEETQLRRLLVELNPDNRAVARFPQFLRLLRKVLNDNLFDLNTTVEQHCERERRGVEVKKQIRPPRLTKRSSSLGLFRRGSRI